MPYSVPEVWVEAADPGMCDFPVRREPGTGNRIPGDFFVSFFGRAKKEMPRRHEASGATGAPRHERTKKEQTPVGDRHIVKPINGRGMLCDLQVARAAASPAETRRRALEPGRNYSILPRVRPYIINPGKTPFPHQRMIAMP